MNDNLDPRTVTILDHRSRRGRLAVYGIALAALLGAALGFLIQ